MAKLRVRLGAAEAEVEAEPEHIKEVIELIPELVSKLQSEMQQRHEPAVALAVPQTAEPASQEKPFQIPNVSVVKGDSLADVITKFFSDKWGTEKRKLSDVREALQSYGLNYPKQSVAVALLRLAKAGKLRRFKAEDGEYVYTSTFPATFQPTQEPQSLLLSAEQ